MSKTIKLLLAGALMLTLVAGAAVAQSAQAFIFCGEQSNEQRRQCNGTPGDDQIIGSQFRDNIFAKGGMDFADGGSGNDKVNGEDGNDQGIFRGNGQPGSLDAGTLGIWQGGGLLGGAGNDTINGGNGDDDLDDTSSGGPCAAGGSCGGGGGGPDEDRLNGGSGSDFMNAADGDGNDVLDGGSGNDLCNADPGDRVISCSTNV